MGFGIYHFGEEHDDDDDDDDYYDDDCDDEDETKVWIINAPGPDSETSSITVLLIAATGTASVVGLGVITYLVVKGALATKAVVSATTSSGAGASSSAP